MFWPSLSVAASLALGAAPLETARGAFEALRCPEALQALDEVDAASGLSIADNVARLEMRAICLAVQKKPQAAEKVFRELVWVAPATKISDEYGPKVRTPYLEARAWVEEEAGLEPRDVRLDTAKEKLLLPKDPLGLIARVEVSWGTQRQELMLGGGEVPVPWPAGVEKATVRVFSKQERLISEVELDAAPPKPAPVAAVVVPPGPPEGPRYRAPAFTLLAVGGASLAGGIAFHIRSYDADRAFGNRDPQLRIVGISQSDAFALEQRVKTDMIVSGALYGLAGACLLTAIVLFIAGAPP